MNSQLSMRNLDNAFREFKRLEELQTNLILNVNLALRKSIEEYLNKQENALDENGEIKGEVTQEIIKMFMEFAKSIILNQERVRKAENREKITARDLDDQLHQANLFNWWTTKQISLYYKLKRLYHSQKAKEYGNEHE